MKEELDWLVDYRVFLVSNDINDDDEVVIKVDERIKELKGDKK